MTRRLVPWPCRPGEIDIAYNLKNENIAEFENNSNITIKQLESLRSTYAFMNQNGPLGDLTLRQALLRGLNKRGLLRQPAGRWRNAWQKRRCPPPWTLASTS